MGPCRSPQSVAIGDLNGDRKPDLVTANHGAGNVSVFLNRGDGRFHAPLDYRAKGEPLSVAIGDLTGDGKPDLATADAETSVSVLVNKGDGSYQRPLTFRGGFAPGSIAMGDLNSDGQADLAIAGVNEQPSNVYVLFNRGRR